MNIFLGIITVLFTLTLSSRIFFPEIMHARVQKQGVNIDKRTIKQRLSEDRKRYHDMFNKEHATAFIMAIFFAHMFLTMIVLGATQSPKAFLVLLSFYVCYEAPILFSQIFSNKIKSYLLIDKKTLKTLSLLNTAGFNITKERLSKDKDFLNNLLNRKILHAETIPEIVVIQELTKEYRHLGLALWTGYENKTNMLHTSPEYQELTELLAKHEERRNVLQKQLFEADKFFFYAVGMIEEPGLIRISEKINKPVVDVTLNQEKMDYLSPAVEALLQIISDPNTDDSIRKHALDTVKEIELKTLEQRSKQKEEMKKTDDMSTIIAARQMHNLDSDM